MTEKQITALLIAEEALKRDGFETFYALTANDMRGRPVASLGFSTIEGAKKYIERVNSETNIKVDFETGVVLVLKAYKGTAGKMETWTDYREVRAPRF